MKKVQLFTDGGCIGNPGPGGWACIVRYGDKTKEMWGCEADTTNNRMELTAAVQGLSSLREPCEVHITTDSNYVKDGITRWIRNWKRNGWRSTTGPVKNQDLWQLLDAEAARHQTHWEWTKGHAAHSDNNRCDELANAAARGQLSGESPE